MKIHRETINVNSVGSRPSFHCVTSEVRNAVARSGISDGFCVVYSHHTTCSVMIQECSFDKDDNGLEFMEQDLLHIFEHIIPTYGDSISYSHPGPLAIKFAAENGESRQEAHNTDAHLRSAFLGRSETVVIIDKQLDLGSFGHIYFVDFDQTRPRERQIQVMLIGD